MQSLPIGGLMVVVIVEHADTHYAAITDVNLYGL